MNLIMLGVVSLLVTCTYRFWRVVVDRRLYFELQAIRDELRWVAITRPTLRDKQAFLHFDRTVAGVVDELETISFWTQLLAKLNQGDAKVPAWFAKFQADIDADAELKALFTRFGLVLIERLRVRHVALIAVIRMCLWFSPRKPRLEERVLRPAFTAFC
jgi:hypothetical protein